MGSQQVILFLTMPKLHGRGFLSYVPSWPCFTTYRSDCLCSELGFDSIKYSSTCVIAFVVGEFAWMQRTLAEAEHLLSRGALYLNAQDGHVYSTSFVFSLLECFILFLRAIYLAIFFTPCIAMAPFAESFGTQYRKTWLHIVHHTLEKAGPAFIKWGQWAATRPDLFARDLCDELAKLHTKAPAHSFSFTRKSIERAFGRELPEIFETFEEEPVASGSVAQVYQATLKYRYPG